MKTMVRRSSAGQPAIRARGGRRVSRSRWGNVILLLVLTLFGIFMALPLVYTIVTAFKPAHEIFVFPPRFFVRDPTVENFIAVYQLTSEMYVPLSRYIFNSLLVAAGGTALYVFVASFAAYPLAKYRFKWVGVYTTVVVWAILFRGEVTSIPQYIIISELHMVNTYFAVILPALGSSFGVFLMIQFMSAFPDSVLEAAYIDGAGEFRVLWSVVMPSVKPAWLTLIIFTFQNFWNATGIQFLYDERLKMLPTVLSQISGGGMARAGASAAVAMILMIPPIVLFLLSQSSVIETMSHAGIK